MRAPVLRRQGMRRRWPDRVRPPVAACQTVVLAPALDRARIRSRQSTGRCLAGAVGAGLGDLGNQGLAIFQWSCVLAFRGRSQSFFDMATRRPFRPALSLRRNLRSSSLIRRRPRASGPRFLFLRVHKAANRILLPGLQLSRRETPCSRHQLRADWFIAAVAITASSRAAGVQCRASSPGLARTLSTPTLQFPR